MPVIFNAVDINLLLDSNSVAPGYNTYAVNGNNIAQVDGSDGEYDWGTDEARRRTCVAEVIVRDTLAAGTYEIHVQESDDPAFGSLVKSTNLVIADGISETQHGQVINIIFNPAARYTRLNYVLGAASSLTVFKAFLGDYKP